MMSDNKPRTRPALAVLALIGAAAAYALSSIAVLERGQWLDADHLAGIAWGLTILLVLAALPLAAGTRRLLLGAWAARLVTALGFALLYEDYYGSLDAFGYHRRAVSNESWPGIGLQGTVNVDALLWVVARVTPSSYHAMKVTLAALGLVAVWIFFRAASTALGRKDPRLFWILALFPSILFWSSILGKEPVMLFALALYAYGTVGLTQRIPRTPVLALVTGTLVLFLVRPWLLAVAALPILGLAHGRARLGPAFPWVVGGLVCLASLTSATMAVMILGIDDPLEFVPRFNELVHAWAEGDSARQAPQFNAPLDILVFLPWGAFTALFRPLPGEPAGHEMFALLAGLESLVLLGLLWMALARLRRLDLAWPLLRWCLLFVLTWAALYGFLSYQNIGTAVRYRMQVLPFLVVGLIVLARPGPAPRGRLQRALLAVPDLAGAALAGSAAIGAALGRILFARRSPKRRRLLVMDTAWSMHVVRQRRLEHSILCRDLGGFFEHVWTVHPLVGAGHGDPPPLAVGPVTEERISARHTVVEGRIGRWAALRDLPNLNFVLAQATLLRRLDRLVREQGIAVLRVGDPYYQGLLGLALARANRVPLAIRVGGPWDAIYAATGRIAYPRIFRRRWVEKRLDRAVLARADLVAGTNQDNLDFALANGARPERSLLFPYGNLIDPMHFQDPAQRPDATTELQQLGIAGRPFAIYVARFERIKNGDDLLRAVASARHQVPSLAAVLVGDGTMRAELQDLVRELGLEGSAILAGARDQRWLATVLPAATAVLALSAGRALVEGALSGRPVVAYDIEWHREFIDDGRTGLLVPYKDVHALRAALVRCALDPGQASAIGRAGRERAMAEHDPARLDEVERAAYRPLLAAAGVPEAP